MKKALKTHFKSHLGLFGYNLLLDIRTRFWVWIILQLVFETVFFFTFNYIAKSNIYFKTRLTWLIIGTILFINYIFFLILSLNNIFKSDVNNGMIVIFMAKPFSRLSLYLNKIVSLFTLCFCYGFFFFIYAIVLSFSMDSASQSMIVDISGYLLLTQLVIFFLIVGFSLSIRISQKGLIIFFSLIFFLIFPLAVVIAPAIFGAPSEAENDSRIRDYNSLTGKDLNIFEQSKYFLKKYGKDEIANHLTNELNEFFNYVNLYNVLHGDINYENHHRIKVIEKGKVFNQTTWENIYINRLFTKWNKDKPVIISANNSLQNVYNNAVIQVKEIKNRSTKVVDVNLFTKLDFYLDLLKFAIVNESMIIDKMKSNEYMKNSFYTPLVFENKFDDSQSWVESNDVTTTAFNSFLTYSFRFYTRIIKPDFIELDKNQKDNYVKYDINKSLKSKLVIPNYFNIFRQILIMWQRPSLTRWRYEMNLGSDFSYTVYNFLNNHDFIPYYQKDDTKRINYLDIEKSGYQFNMPVIYICYILVGLGFIVLSWLNYRKKDLV